MVYIWDMGPIDGNYFAFHSIGQEQIWWPWEKISSARLAEYEPEQYIQKYECVKSSASSQALYVQERFP